MPLPQFQSQGLAGVDAGQAVNPDGAGQPGGRHSPAVGKAPFRLRASARLSSSCRRGHRNANTHREPGRAAIRARRGRTVWPSRWPPLGKADGCTPSPAPKFAPPIGVQNFDPLWREVLPVALAPSELVGVGELTTPFFRISVFRSSEPSQARAFATSATAGSPRHSGSSALRNTLPFVKPAEERFFSPPS